MLQEVDLASLSVLESEPVRVSQLLTIETIALVWVAELRRFCKIRERFLVNGVELAHELSSENLESHAHNAEVHGQYVLKYKCENNHQYE